MVQWFKSLFIQMCCPFWSTLRKSLMVIEFLFWTALAFWGGFNPLWLIEKKSDEQTVGENITFGDTYNSWYFTPLLHSPMLTSCQARVVFLITICSKGFPTIFIWIKTVGLKIRTSCYPLNCLKPTMMIFNLSRILY